MKKILIPFLTFFMGLLAHGQSPAVVSHYPASAYVVNRLLPFEVVGEGDSKLVQIVVQKGRSCSSLMDPFYPNVFHIYCREPEVIDISIRVEDFIGGDTLLELNDVSIATQRAAGDTFDTQSASTGSAGSGP